MRFITGITGQFFRQFALTIADLDGDLGVQLADAQPGAGGAAAASREQKGVFQALPWPAFVAVGRLGGLRVSGPAAAQAGADRGLAARLAVGLRSSWPRTWSGLAVGALAGCVVSGVLNRVFGWTLLPVQRGVRRRDGALHPDGRRPAAGQRRWCSLLYGGLLGLTYWGFTQHADRVHPGAGQGLSAGQRAAARLVLARADPAGDEAGRGDRQQARRASRTRWRSPGSRSC